MYHDPNFDFKAHYKAVRARLTSPVKKVLPKPVALVESAKPELVSALHAKKSQAFKLASSARDWLLIETPSEAHGFKHILRQVSLKYGVTEMDILSPRRTEKVLLPRHEVFYRLRTETKLTFPQVGRLMNRDHTTALHGFRKYTKLLAEGKVTL